MSNKPALIAGALAGVAVLFFGKKMNQLSTINWGSNVAYSDPKHVELVVTKLSMAEILAGLREAVPGLSSAAYLLLAAQYAVETAAGRACYCYNFGNTKWAPGVPLDHFSLEGTGENIAENLVDYAKSLGPVRSVNPSVPGKKQVILGAEHPWAQFRAYRSARDGLLGWMQVLRQNNFRAARTYLEGLSVSELPAIKAADSYAAILYAGSGTIKNPRMGYFTANPGAYARALKSHLESTLRGLS